MSELDYRDNYSSLIEALQMGGAVGAENVKPEKVSEGLVRRLKTEKSMSDDKSEDQPLSKRILNKMDSVRKENKVRLESLSKTNKKEVLE
tara:strand:- start:43 stop:312 length:270 start_codon:yes stop_codon:yes gene_type:complete